MSTLDKEKLLKFQKNLNEYTSKPYNPICNRVSSDKIEKFKDGLVKSKNQKNYSHKKSC